MYEVYYAIGGWDHCAAEPALGFVPVEGPVDSAREAVELMVVYSAVMARKYGPGEMVVLDAEAGRWRGENVRVDPYALAVRESMLALEAAG